MPGLGAALAGAQGQNVLPNDNTERSSGNKIPLWGRLHRLPRKIEDDYELTSVTLGTGLSGNVRMAISKQPGRDHKNRFAVKTFKLSNLKPKEKELLVSEVEIFLCLDHPHIARLVDVYEDATAIHLVMESLEGGELFARITKVQRFSETEAARATRQMLLALNYMHAHNIVHRDLKLENFLYDKVGGDYLKLIDFGFSKFRDSSAKLKTRCGTMSYVAPEVFEQCYNRQCDMWSLGVVVFVLLSGQMPFAGAAPAVAQKIREGKYIMTADPWCSISRSAKSFVRSLLEVSPSKRLTAQDALRHAWLQLKAAVKPKPIDGSMAEAIQTFSKSSHLRRCCHKVAAWSLSNEEQAKVRQDFEALDQSQRGALSFTDFKTVLGSRFSEDQLSDIFAALALNGDQEVQYSDFLAAMISTKLTVSNELVSTAFRKFDNDDDGCVPSADVLEVIGPDHFLGGTDQVLEDAGLSKGSSLSLRDFAAFMRGESVSSFEVSFDTSDSLLEVSDVTQRGSGHLQQENGDTPCYTEEIGDAKKHDVGHPESPQRSSRASSNTQHSSSKFCQGASVLPQDGTTLRSTFKDEDAEAGGPSNIEKPPPATSRRQPVVQVVPNPVYQGCQCSIQ